MSNVTLNQMAEGYVNSVKQELQKARDVLAENQKYVANLEAHLKECLQALQEPEENSETTTEMVAVPNPFGKISNQTGESEV